MKFKTSAIALAVAGTVAAPQLVQAGADEIYASARVGVEQFDQDGVADLRVRSFGSRFGARGETDLGNGLTGFGRYEWDVDFGDFVDTVSPDGDSGVQIRHRYVGLKGDFGSVLLGHTYHTFYNFTVGPIDQPWWGSGYAMVNYVGRTPEAVTYAGSSGAVNFGLTAHMFRESEEEAIDVLELGGSAAIGDMTLGVALRSPSGALGETVVGGEDDVLSVTLSGIALGDASLAVNFQTEEDDTSFTGHLGVGNAYLHLSQLSVDSTDQDILHFTLGYTQSLGRKTTAWYEFVSIDRDTGDSDDDRQVIRGVLKYDII